MNKLYVLMFSLIFVLMFSVVAEDVRNVQISSDNISSRTLDDNIELSTGRNPQTGKEIQIAASRGEMPSLIEAEAKFLINDNLYSVDTSINFIQLNDYIDLSTERCGVSRNNEIVCEVRPYDGSDESRIDDDNSLYCWGNNELRECPDEEIVSGTGSGKVSVEDIKIKSIDGNEEEIEILSWSWGVSSRSSDLSDVDEDNIELSYVWFAHGDDRPTESLSLAFGKIELVFKNEDGSDNQVEIEFPEIEVSKNNLIFTTIVFDKYAISDDGERCPVSNILDGEDCNDEDVEIRPDVIDPDDNQNSDLLELVFSELSSKADAKKALDAFISVVNNIKDSLDRCEDDVCRQVELNADKRKTLLEKAKDDIINSPPVVSEIKSIIEEDINSLDRCESDVCYEVLNQERELLNLVDYYIDLIIKSGDTIWPSEWVTDLNLSKSIDDNIPDSLDIDDDNDGILTRDEPSVTINRDVALSRAFNDMSRKTIWPGNWSIEDKETIGEYIRSLDTIEREDFALAIAYQASNNERVREIRFNDETNKVEIDHDEEIRLLGIIRINARARTIIDEQGNEETMLPWWSFLATKDKGKSESGRFGYSVEEGKKL